jgi:hypothetical protein
MCCHSLSFRSLLWGFWVEQFSKVCWAKRVVKNWCGFSRGLRRALSWGSSAIAIGIVRFPFLICDICCRGDNAGCVFVVPLIRRFEVPAVIIATEPPTIEPPVVQVRIKFLFVGLAIIKKTLSHFSLDINTLVLRQGQFPIFAEHPEM